MLVTGKYLLDPVDFGESARSEFEFKSRRSVGLVSLQIGGSDYTLTFEVLPRKIEYRTDYRAMKADLANHAHALAFDVLGRAEERAKQFRVGFPLEAESHAIARVIVRELIRLLDVVEQQPNTQIRPVEQLARISWGKRMSIRNWQRLVRARPYAERPVLLIQRTELSVQTAENQFIKWVLTKTSRRLVALLRMLRDPERHEVQESTSPFATEVAKVKQILRNREHRGFLGEVEGRQPTGRQLSLVFQLHPVYRRIYHLCLLLLSGLELEGYVFQMGMKDVATIYEYWCFLMVVAVLQRHCLVDSSSLIKIKQRRANLVLVQGRESIVSLRRKEGTQIQVRYNPLIEPSFTTPQQPDAVIEIVSEHTHLILDAKYRLQFDPGYVRHYGGPGPTEEDINKMHRYRDAVLFRSPKGLMKATEAVALFPLPARVAYLDRHRLYQSLDLVGVGGVPCHPGNLDGLDKYLSTRLHLLRPR